MKFWSLIVVLLFSLTSLGANFNFDKEHDPNELIVKFKSDVESFSAIYDLGGEVLHEYDVKGLLLVGFPHISPKGLKKAAKKLDKNPNVEFVEANTIIQLSAQPDRGRKVPNDKHFRLTWGLHNDGSQVGSVEDADIDAPEAWKITTGSRDVTVAIIDTGVDYNHDDLKANYWRNPGESGAKANNGIDDDGNGYVDDWGGWDFANNDNDPIDDHSHGTHCAGTIGAQGDNSIGVTGVNWQVSMVGLKFLDHNGRGKMANGMKAIEYATRMKFNIINASWGGGGPSDAMKAVLRQANQRDVLFVAAAGNSGTDNDREAFYPANYNIPNVMSVGASDMKERLAGFSNYGKRTVHVVAPGMRIYSTYTNNRYGQMSGTSMATPHVAGVAALIKAKYPDLSAVEIKNRIMVSSDSVPVYYRAAQSGGRLNAYNALEVDRVPPAPLQNIRISDKGITTLALKVQPTGDDGREGQAHRYVARVSKSPITSESDWSRARRVSAHKGETENDVLIGSLKLKDSGYLSVRAADNVGNLSPLTSSFSFSTLSTSKLAGHSADSSSGTLKDGTWGVERLKNWRFVFSDSPGKWYKNNTNSSLTVFFKKVRGTKLAIEFDTKYEIDANHDFGIVKVSVDRGYTWHTVEKFSGDSTGWRKALIDLTEHGIVHDRGEFQLKFNMKTNSVMTNEGWFIDNIKIFGN